MNQLKTIALFLSVLFLSTVSYAEDEKVSDNKEIQIRPEQDFKDVIEEYKKYAAKIPPEVREEIIAYRKEVAKLNKKKRMLFKKLSSSAQEYLKKEQKFKKKLPLKKRKLLKMQTPAQDTAK